MLLIICFKCLSASGKDIYDGYFVFDADNYVDPNFVKEMNATFDSGHFAALTSYPQLKKLWCKLDLRRLWLMVLARSTLLKLPKNASGNQLCYFRNRLSGIR